MDLTHIDEVKPRTIHCIQIYITGKINHTMSAVGRLKILVRVYPLFSTLSSV